MIKPRAASRVLIPALSVGLFACQGPAVLPPAASFQLGPNALSQAAQPKTTSTQAAVSSRLGNSAPVAPPARAATTGVSGGGLPSNSETATSSGGTVTVDLGSVLSALRAAGHYRVLATAADIDHLIITLSMPGQPDLVQVVTASQITGGESTVTFTGLPTGTAAISIVAYDSSGYDIGSTSQSTSVTNGMASSVAVSVPIDPSASPASIGSGTVSVNLNFATPPPSGTVLATFNIAAQYLFADDLGHFYAERYGCPNQQGATSLGEFSASDGSLLETAMTSVYFIGNPLCMRWAPLAYAKSIKTLYYAELGPMPSPSATAPAEPALVAINTEGLQMLAVDSVGNAFFPRGGTLTKVAVDGTTFATGIPSAGAIAIDPSDDFWANELTSASATTVADAVTEYTPAGVLKGTYSLPFAPIEIKAANDGSVWLTNGFMTPAGTELVKVSASGIVSAPITIAIQDYCIDTNNNVWVATGTSLVKLSSNGAQIATYPLAASCLASGGGLIFAGVLTPTNAQQVVEVEP